MTASSTLVVTPTTGRSLISAELWDMLVKGVTKDLEFKQIFGDADEATLHNWAKRSVEQMLSYLQVVGIASSGEMLFPTHPIDCAWHTFILHTRAYAAFCERVAGRMIHHDPVFAGSIDPTITAMRAHGLPVDEGVWAFAAVDCIDDGG